MDEHGCFTTLEFRNFTIESTLYVDIGVEFLS